MKFWSLTCFFFLIRNSSYIVLIFMLGQLGWLLKHSMYMDSFNHLIFQYCSFILISVHKLNEVVKSKFLEYNCHQKNYFAMYCVLFTLTVFQSNYTATSNSQILLFRVRRTENYIFISIVFSKSTKQHDY